jgi:hypothetical protein
MTYWLLMAFIYAFIGNLSIIYRVFHTAAEFHPMKLS